MFEAECGKGTYVRALARDMGRELGCLGHITALRRTRVGPFTEEDAVEPAEIEALAEVTAGTGPVDFGNLVLPVQSALDEVEEVPVSRDAATRVMRGQSVILRGRDAPMEGQVFVSLAGDAWWRWAMSRTASSSPTGCFTSERSEPVSAGSACGLR